MFNPMGSPPVQDLRLTVRRESKTGHTLVSSPTRPELGTVRDPDQRMAIQEFRSRADRSADHPPTHMLPGENRDY